MAQKDYAAMLEYQRNVQALLAEVSKYVPDQLLVEPRRLVEHGEAPLGMTQMAWMLSDEQLSVPAALVQRMREYADVNEAFPPDLPVL